MRLLDKFRFAVPLSLESNLGENGREHEGVAEVRRCLRSGRAYFPPVRVLPSGVVTTANEHEDHRSDEYMKLPELR